MSKKTRRTTVRVAAAAGMALSVGAANATPMIDGPEGIGGTVWNDLDMDGKQGGLGEDGITGVTVNLLTSGSLFIDSTLTDALGDYAFSGLGDYSQGPEDVYIVEFELPLGFVFSPQDAGLDDLDSDADPLTGKTDTITLTPNVPIIATVDAGMYRVPAPTVLSLLGIGLTGLGLQQRRRKKKA